MRKSTFFVIVILVVGGLILYSSAYTVNEAEQVVIVRLGEVIGEAVSEPGLHFKVPIFDEAKRFEKRWLEWE